MTSNFTTLALNLLISERINHRIIFADKIIELLYQNLGDTQTDSLAKSQFLSAISNCTQNPNCEDRKTLILLADYFASKTNNKTSFSEVA